MRTSLIARLELFYDKI